MKPFTHKEYKCIEQIYDEYMYIQSIITQDSPDTDWERYHDIECMYYDEWSKLID
jgi:hypothetical protein